MNFQRLVPIPALLAAVLSAAVAAADPCGLVPPILTMADGRPPITRVGAQRTYVFYKDGIESIAIRPAFSGRVDEFGMLIPFPSPPAIKKAPDGIFEALAYAVDPPEVVHDLRVQRRLFSLGAEVRALRADSLDYQVEVIKEEAVGMYDVAVLSAGSAEALERWMTAHGYRYPTGMNEVCDEYVREGWCFVAVKARVGAMPQVEPRPGLREVDPTLPTGATFDGAVQAMSFRFRTDELVVPMRLSAFNEGELHNIIYLLTDGPKRVRNLPTSLVVRQLPGHRVFANLTQLLPLRVLSPSSVWVPDSSVLHGLRSRRRPEPFNGPAKDLIAADLQAVRRNALEGAFETREKELLKVSERLGLRGMEIDELHAAALRSELDGAAHEALADLNGMTLTVIDGDFDRDVLAADNLRFDDFRMADSLNRPEVYDAAEGGPAPERTGFLYRGSVVPGAPTGGSRPPAPPLHGPWGLAVAGGALLGLTALARRRVSALPAGLRRRPLAAAAGAVVLVLAGAHAGAAPAPREDDAPSVAAPLIELAANAEADLLARGWAIVALADLPDKAAEEALLNIHRTTGHALVRGWTGAAYLRGARDLDGLWRRANRLQARTPEELFAEQLELNVRRRGPLQPAVMRWIADRIPGLVSGEAEADAKALFNLHVLAPHPSVATAIAAAFERVGPEPLVARALGADSDSSRRQAAGWLATLARQGGSPAVTDALLAQLCFDAEAQRVPWDGGSLFLPAAPWSGAEAAEVYDTLMRWRLWCWKHGKVSADRQVQNNLSQICSQIGRTGPFDSPVECLADWARWVGERELDAVVAALGLEEHAAVKELRAR
ncbi:MAG: DUF2330 domain-containing protein [Planctomycetota bacterium]